jgi:hypothetical protein
MLTNLRFADDLLLIGKSLHQVKAMLEDLMTEAAAYGLEAHPGKTKFMWNGEERINKQENVDINGQKFEVLNPAACTDYLGRSLSLLETHDTELQNRASKAWRKFGAFRDELTDKAYPIGQRLRVFKSVVQPCMLYGSCSWVMTRRSEQLLKSTQRKMMKTILGRRRL